MKGVAILGLLLCLSQVCLPTKPEDEFGKRRCRLCPKRSTGSDESKEQEGSILDRPPRPGVRTKQRILNTISQTLETQKNATKSRLQRLQDARRTAPMENNHPQIKNIMRKRSYYRTYSRNGGTTYGRTTYARRAVRNQEERSARRKRGYINRCYGYGRYGYTRYTYGYGRCRYPYNSGTTYGRRTTRNQVERSAQSQKNRRGEDAPKGNYKYENVRAEPYVHEEVAAAPYVHEEVTPYAYRRNLDSHKRIAAEKKALSRKPSPSPNRRHLATRKAAAKPKKSLRNAVRLEKKEKKTG